jgi:hypothetical protein
MVYADETILAESCPGDAENRVAEHLLFTDEMRVRGVWRDEARLRPSDTATTVRVREGEVVVGDGPFAETKEQIGGFYLIECGDLDEAIEIAAKIPSARRGAIEVRPVWEI